jgi:hypothetical protein
MLIAGVAPPDDTTGEVPVTEVTVPEPLLLKVVQSVELNAPRFDADAVGTFKVITGVVVPVATVLDKSVPVVPSVSAATDVTVPEPLLLKVVQSVLVKYPLTEVVAAGIDITGVAPPDDTTGAVPDTLETPLVVITVYLTLPVESTTCHALPCVQVNLSPTDNWIAKILYVVAVSKY